MKIWDLCIRRPVFTAMLVAAPIVLGVASYRRLGVDLFPNVDLPVVVVTTSLKGASVEEMETSVTKPIEEIVNTISGIDELRSTTKEGTSQVVVQFLLEKNGEVAAQEVRDRISTILGRFPVGTDPPLIDKFDIGAAPIMQIAVSGKRDIREVSEIARKIIKENLETVSGVGSVTLVGARPRAIQIRIKPDALLSWKLTIEDVRQGLLKQNLELPGGRVDRGDQELVLRTMGRLESIAAFSDLIVAERGGHAIRIRDVGTVEDGYEEPRGLARLDGNNAVTLIIQKQSGKNTVEVVDNVKKRLAEIAPLLPADITTETIRDQSRFIRNSIDEVKFHLLLASILVALTILLFIRDWRTTLIASLSIPASIIGTFAFMDAMGFTLNNITMLGLILAVGIVIDDAVVVHENIFRYMEEHGLAAREAASKATQEIALAVLATTLSLLVIFVPVAFMSGRIGRFFNSFGYTVGFAVLMSLFVSMTMTPMLCSRFLKLAKGHKGSKAGYIWPAIEGTYGAILAWSLRHRWVIVLATVGLIATTPVVFGMVGKDFVPRDDQSEFEVAITLPEGSSLARADRDFAEIEARLKTLRGVTHVFATIGDTSGRLTRGQGDVTTGSIYVRLIDLKDRKYTQFDVMRDARQLMLDWPDFRTAVQDVQAFSSSGFRQVAIDLNLRGPDLRKLGEYAEKISTFMKERRHYVDIDTSLSLRKPELRVHINRDAAADQHVEVRDIASALNVLVGGEPISKYKEGDEQYDVWLRAEASNRSTTEQLEALTVPAAGRPPVRLSTVASLVPEKGPGSIDRFGRQRQVVVSSNLDGAGMGDAVTELTAFVGTLNLPEDYHWEFLGRAKVLKESNDNFLIAFLLSFVFMYMILAAQFESFVHPITILLSLPLTLPFAIVSLILLKTSLDIYAIFGLFMLFGIVKKNGILQLDYTNVLRKRGIARDPAILEANRTRLRPILMTTAMLVAAMIPIALGKGPGAASRASMAKVILGGQTLSLLLTLLVTPVAYSLWDDVERLWRRIRGVKEEAPKPEGSDSGEEAILESAE